MLRPLARHIKLILVEHSFLSRCPVPKPGKMLGKARKREAKEGEASSNKKQQSLSSFLVGYADAKVVLEQKEKARQLAKQVSSSSSADAAISEEERRLREIQAEERLKRKREEQQKLDALPPMKLHRVAGGSSQTALVPGMHRQTAKGKASFSQLYPSTTHTDTVIVSPPAATPPCRPFDRFVVAPEVKSSVKDLVASVCVLESLEVEGEGEALDQVTMTYIDQTCKKVMDGIVLQLSAKETGLVVQRVQAAENPAATLTKARHHWSGRQKNMYVTLLEVYKTPAKLLEALAKEGHKLLPTEWMLLRWKSKYPFSDLDSRDLMAKAVSDGKLTNKAYDQRVLGRLLLLLSLGAKGGNKLIVAAAKQIRLLKDFKGDEALAKLKFSPGWLEKFKKRHNMVSRKGDKMKQGKVPGPAEIDANQKEYQRMHTELKIHPLLQFSGDETMTRLFELPERTLAVKGQKRVYLATTPDEKAGMTDWFWMTPARIDGKSGGQLMAPMTILTGISDKLLHNVMVELVSEGQDLLNALKPNPNPMPIMRGPAGKKKDVRIPLDQLPDDRARNPPFAWTSNFIFYWDIPEHYGARLGTNGVDQLPYFMFKDGQIITCSKSGWMRAETWIPWVELMLRPEIRRRKQYLLNHGLATADEKLYSSHIDDSYGVHDNKEGDKMMEEEDCKHSHIVPNASGEHQGADTHINGPYKSGMGKLYSEYQHDKISEELEEHHDELAELEQKVADGVDPMTLSTWKSPMELNMPQPSRARVILMGRKVREQFETEAGRAIVTAAFYDNGLIKGGPDNSYLLYSARKARERASVTATKIKKKGKKMLARVKEEQQGNNFKEVIAMVGLNIGNDGHTHEV